VGTKCLSVVERCLVARFWFVFDRPLVLIWCGQGGLEGLVNLFLGRPLVGSGTLDGPIPKALSGFGPAGNFDRQHGPLGRGRVGLGP